MWWVVVYIWGTQTKNTILKTQHLLDPYKETPVELAVAFIALFVVAFCIIHYMWGAKGCIIFIGILLTLIGLYLVHAGIYYE